MSCEEDSKLNDCGCCEDIHTKKITPARIFNSPALLSIKYRVGTHSQFKASMLATFSKALPALKTREDDDLAIGVVDAWAIVGDVLSFYQERIANEAFLRTATERLSVLELARAIGYELSPGVAASTFLAFSIDDTSGTLEKTLIEPGTKVQSIPEDGKLPQTFETAEKLEARPEWNELKPKITIPQIVNKDTPRFYFKGTDTKLRSGDGMLIVKMSVAPAANDAIPLGFSIVSKVTQDGEAHQTIVDVIPVVLQPTQEGNLPEAVAVETVSAAAVLGEDVIVGTDLFKTIMSGTLTSSELSELSAKANISTKEMVARINYLSADLLQQQAAGGFELKVYALRRRVGSFGGKKPALKLKVPINKDPNNNTEYDTHEKNLIFLDNSYPDVMKSNEEEDSWAVLQSAATEDRKCSAYKISDTLEETKVGFSLSSIKVTGLRLDLAPEKDSNPLGNFKLGKTTIFVKSERLDLAQEIEIEIDKNPLKNAKSITLDRAVHGLTVSQYVAVTGMEAQFNSAKSLYEPTGVIKSEIALLSKISLIQGCTRLTFERELVNTFMLDTVKLIANVVRANHGETKNESLGSGDPSQQQQQFMLKQAPLTYVSSSGVSGSESTLKLRVDDIFWKEFPSLYNLGPRDHAYIVRIADGGETKIIFGDGIRGRRPPAGTENIKVKYRVGIGKNGMVKAGQLILLMDRPHGVRSVINPTGATGAEDPEELDDARMNAPMKVLTLDRIVSVKDFEDFAMAFSGIGKAQSIWLWSGEKRIVHLTIASAAGEEEVEEQSDLHKNLRKAIDSVKDPLIHVEIQSFIHKQFNVEANLLIAEDRDLEDVKKEVREALIDRFSFEKREFSQDVFLSEVMAVIQRVEGVVAVDIDHLYLFSLGAVPTLNPVIAAEIAHLENGKMMVPAELLTINPQGVILGVMMQP